MVQGTTPTITLRIKDIYNVDLTQAEDIYFTISQGGKTITKTTTDLLVGEDARSVSVILSQEESFTFSDKYPVEVQLNWIYHDGYGNLKRAATIVKSFIPNKQLYKDVIE